MNWEELLDKHTKDYAAHLESVKKSREQLDINKQKTLSAIKCSEAELPEPIKDMLQRESEAWEKEYNLYGTRFKEMRFSHQRDLKKYFDREAFAQDLSKEDDNGKTKGKSNGR